jgi:hypothetical protein
MIVSIVASGKTLVEIYRGYTNTNLCSYVSGAEDEGQGFGREDECTI